MNLYTVWRKTGMGTGLNEKCLMTIGGDYVGQETGTRYDQATHYHSLQLRAMIKTVDKENKTGMYHLYDYWSEAGEDNAKSVKEKYVGCIITVEEAHSTNHGKVYRCNELNEYFSESEIEILTQAASSQKD